MNSCYWGKNQASLAPPQNKVKPCQKPNCQGTGYIFKEGRWGASLPVCTLSLTVGQEPWVLGLCVQEGREWERGVGAGSSHEDCAH